MTTARQQKLSTLQVGPHSTNQRKAASRQTLWSTYPLRIESVCTLWYSGIRPAEMDLDLGMPPHIVASDS
jgi:hypothetical protein